MSKFIDLHLKVSAYILGYSLLTLNALMFIALWCLKAWPDDTFWAVLKATQEWPFLLNILAMSGVELVSNLCLLSLFIGAFVTVYLHRKTK